MTSFDPSARYCECGALLIEPETVCIDCAFDMEHDGDKDDQGDIDSPSP